MLLQPVGVMKCSLSGSKRSPAAAVLLMYNFNGPSTSCCGWWLLLGSGLLQGGSITGGPLYVHSIPLEIVLFAFARMCMFMS